MLFGKGNKRDSQRYGILSALPWLGLCPTGSRIGRKEPDADGWVDGDAFGVPLAGHWRAAWGGAQLVW